jgi:hypothetical protein
MKKCQVCGKIIPDCNYAIEPKYQGKDLCVACQLQDKKQNWEQAVLSRQTFLKRQQRKGFSKGIFGIFR